MMVNLLMLCPNCNKNVNVRLGQVDRIDSLSWFRSWSCDNCGFSLEESGDETPSELRETLINEEGVWALVIYEECKNSSALKILKGVLGLSLKEIIKLKKDKSGCVFTGTKSEVEFYQGKCRSLGVNLHAISNWTVRSSR